MPFKLQSYLSKTNRKGHVILHSDVNFHILKNIDDLPDWLSMDALTEYLNINMVPYEDQPHDVQEGLRYALSLNDGPGGFIVIAEKEQEVLGCTVTLFTGMKGYVPENIILFACVHPNHRGQGLGRKLFEKTMERCDGDIKLHVEYDNPAKKLYERLGFQNKYAEMRYVKGES